MAEKLEAIVRFGTVNARFKDFFDLDVLSRERTFDSYGLRKQIEATFSGRDTDLLGGARCALAFGARGDELTPSRACGCSCGCCRVLGGASPANPTPSLSPPDGNSQSHTALRRLWET